MSDAIADDAPSPYRITGPALISFSGGRTSAFMLHHIIDAHGGALPDDVVPVFANTGKEREETLRFVHECGVRWGVKIHWIEWTRRKPWHTLVGYNSAARAGEPFAELIRSKMTTPNSMRRFCTEHLKVKAIEKFCTLTLGWSEWSNVVGLRYDEGHRVLKALAKNDDDQRPYKSVMPIAKAKHTRRDVMAFWAGQPFDLGLRSYEGNCDLCFLKGQTILEAIARENPGATDWWVEQEVAGKGTFRPGLSYRDIERRARDQTHMFDVLDDEDHDVECGLLCAPDMEAAR